MTDWTKPRTSQDIPFPPKDVVEREVKGNLDYLKENMIKADGTVPFTANQSMGSHKLTNVTDPTTAQDASTKKTKYRIYP